ncbi:MAG: hypothetical protein WBY88_14915, partial [Desulfosarcina sp.]
FPASDSLNETSLNLKKYPSPCPSPRRGEGTPTSAMSIHWNVSHHRLALSDAVGIVDLIASQFPIQRSTSE